MQTVLGDSEEDVMRRPRSWQQGQHSTCGKNPVYQEMQAPERYSFPAVRWAVSSVRTII